MWAGLEQLAHTLSYDLRITARGRQRLAQVPAVARRRRSSWTEARARPGCARRSRPWHAPFRTRAHRTLEGQTHAVDPRALAQALETFLDA